MATLVQSLILKLAPRYYSSQYKDLFAQALELAVWGAHRNVLINMQGVEKETWMDSVLSEAQMMMANATLKANLVVETINARPPETPQ